MNPATATRQEIRQFVLEREQARLAIVKAGGSIEHAEIDQHDELCELLKDLSFEEKERFLNIHTEEGIARIHINAKADAEKNLRKVKNENDLHAKHAWVVAFLVVIAILFFAIKR